jgi:hypothetical protein
MSPPQLPLCLTCSLLPSPGPLHMLSPRTKMFFPSPLPAVYSCSSVMIQMSWMPALTSLTWSALPPGKALSYCVPIAHVACPHPLYSCWGVHLTSTCLPLYTARL